MKLRHAAALALVGWYLILAPKTDDGRADLGAPVSSWHKVRRFDSVRDCERLRDVYRSAAKKPPTPESEASLKIALAAECIATDDSRLKESPK